MPLTPSTRVLGKGGRDSNFQPRFIQAPFNTARDPLGYASMASSLRFARLAPDQRCKSVAHPNKKPVLSVSLSLPRAGAPAMTATGPPWAPLAGLANRQPPQQDDSRGARHYYAYTYTREPPWPP
jgi:hypothetical protein